MASANLKEIAYPKSVDIIYPVAKTQSTDTCYKNQLSKAFNFYGYPTNRQN
jgi:hypothetical protein